MKRIYVTRLLALMFVLMVVFCLSQVFLLGHASPSETAVLLIVAHEDFLDELQPLVDWKNRTGIPTIIVSWQSLDRDCVGSDVPKRIKRGIADLQQRYGIQYVMLVGDSHNFPVRYQINDREGSPPGAPDTLVAVGAYFACDLYYADLYDESGDFDSWDYDRNLYYGELWGEHYSGPINHDRIDMIPDVAVGRVPASDEAEVTHYVDKIIHYESTLVNTWETWISNVLFTVTTTDFPSWYPTKEDAIETYSDTTFLLNKPTPNFWTMYSEEVSSTTDYVPSANMINYLINTTGIGLINFGGHGSQGFLQGGSYFSALAGAYTTWDLIGLNSMKYPIVFSCGCGTGKFSVEPPYDPYICENGITHTGTELGETFSTSEYPPRPDPLQPRIPPATGWSDEIDSFGEYGLVRTQFYGHPVNGGFIAFIGCITGAQEPIGELDKYFLEAFFTLNGPEKRIGDLWKYMIERYCDQHGYGRGEHSKTAHDWFDIAKYHQPMKVSLFGDPSLRVGGVPHLPPLLQSAGSLPSFPEGTTVDFSTYISYWFHAPERNIHEYDPAGAPEYRIDSDGDGSWDSRHFASEWITSPTYKYRDDFTGSVRIQASDGEYYSEILDFTIEVYNVSPSPEIETPVVEIYYDYSNMYRFLAGDPGDDTFTYTIDFGDGSSEIVETTSEKSIGIYHTYDYLGEYTIQVIVADDDGEENSTSVTVQVVPPDPTIDWVRRVTQKLGGGRPEIGFLVFGIMVTAPPIFAVTAWLKIPKWRRGCPMAARLIISVLPTIAVIISFVMLGIIPLLEFLTSG